LPISRKRPSESTSGKDAFDAVGVGAFFNLMNFGQMLMWHIVLIPLVLIALVGAHVLAVRVRGVAHPLPVRRARGKRSLRAAAAADLAEWRGPTRRYDIVKEATVATLIALILVVALAGLLSSPDDPPVTIATWAKIVPADFVATAASELAGTSETATYGPPYNNVSGSSQSLLFSPRDHHWSAPTNRRGKGLRPGSLRKGRPYQSDARSGTQSRQQCHGGHQDLLEQRLREGRDQSEIPQRHRRRAFSG
jgi:hypothetical protein